MENPQAEPTATRSRHGVEWMAALLATAAVGWSFRDGFAYLVDKWDADPNYSYGYFVIPIALAILWSRRDRIDRAKFNPKWWGFIPLVALLAVRYPLYEWNELYIERATIPLVVGASVFAVGGWHLFWATLPAVGFLFFLLPLPESLNISLAAPLQTLATKGSVAVLLMLGLPVMAEGNVILVGQETLEVARACNGLSMLLSFVTLVTATVILSERPWFDRGVLLMSAIPIAMISNVLRIVATALVYHFVGHEAGERVAHDFAGWAMMPLAMALVWVELKVLSWLFVEEGASERPRRFVRTARARPARGH